ncbi:GH25 family lysozyme [Cohnella sp. GCM10012308]|uniref:GH25 family lysozyme n=1 Tax=Cohnella sp. GCM10012308 TaxID=3317329 RepID=UPI003615C78F
MQKRSNNNAEGIDVSHHNGKVDWPKVAADGISFAFLKASQGQLYRDPTFADHIKAARAAGIMVGAYHFVDAKSVLAAQLEAANFAESIAAAGGVQLLDLPPVMDYENNPGGLSQAKINEVAMAFLAELERLTGRRPMVYTGNSFGFNFGPQLSAYPLWIARYSASTPPDNNQAWREWTIWQYSDGSAGGVRANGSRKVAGLPGAVDLNVYAGTGEQLRAAYGPKPDPKPDGKDTIKVVVNDKLAAYGRLINGHVYLPLRQLGEALGKAINWDNEKKLPYVDGKAVYTFQLIDNVAFVGVRAAADVLGATVSWDNVTKKVYLYK